ncbi:hypothetical protein ACX9NE_26925 [Mycobacterium sp. ML4]
MAKPYAYMCTLCDHLATSHRAIPGAAIVEGPYACTYTGCTCEISQTTPLYGMDEATYNIRYRPEAVNNG